MAVYVDNGRWPYSRNGRMMLVSHMIADSSEELEAMAKKLGFKKAWCQHKGTWREHYDVSQTKREEAIRLGAIQISVRSYVTMVNDRCPTHGRFITMRQVHKEEVWRLLR